MSDIEINKSVSLSLNPAKEVTVTNGENGGHDSDQWTQVRLASHWSMLCILASHWSILLVLDFVSTLHLALFG